MRMTAYARNIPENKKGRGQKIRDGIFMSDEISQNGGEQNQTAAHGAKTETKKSTAVHRQAAGQTQKHVRSKTGGQTPSLKIIPLGGLEQIGMNITAIEYGDSIAVVDCGIAFPDDSTPGAEAIIPDVTYLRDNIAKVKGFVITHGHEDHIGSLPYILRQVNVPVYATELTAGLIAHKLEEADLKDCTKLKTVHFGDSVTLGEISVEFIKTNHSITDAAALAIKTPAGTVIHTGDFKVDYTPVYDDPIDLARFAELGKKGVLAMLCDSTNAEKPGFTPSEKTVGKVINGIFDSNPSKRIIVATFASNVDRVQQIVNAAAAHGRRVLLEGRSMVTVCTVASELHKINIPQKTLITEEDLGNFRDNQLCVICTGSQGENMAALSRMSEGTHRKIRIGQNDVVVFSSHPIPGNEKSVSAVISSLEMLGAEVVFQDTHVSGHACAEDIKLLYTLVKPKFAAPLHGEFRHRKAGAKLAEDTGVPKENIFMLMSGDVLEFRDGKASVTGTVTHGAMPVDGRDGTPATPLILRDRQVLGESGIVIIAGAYEKSSGILTAGPDIFTRGFAKNDTSGDLLKEIGECAVETMKHSADRNGFLAGGVPVGAVQQRVSDLIWKRTGKRPIIEIAVCEV